MERILCASLTLFYTIGGSEVLHTAAPDSTSPSNFESKVTVPRARLKLYGDNIAKLQSIRDDVNLFVATYDRPLTKEPSTFKYFRRVSRKLPFESSRITKPKTRRTSYVLPRTYPAMRDRRTAIYDHFLRIFSFNNDTMKETLLSMSNVTTGWKKHPSQCLNDTFSDFRTRCDYGYYHYGGLKQMRGLLQQTCSAGWMSTQQILHIIQTCCQDRFQFSLFRMEVIN